MSITWWPPRRSYTLIPAIHHHPHRPHHAPSPPSAPPPWGNSHQHLVRAASAKIAWPTWCCTKGSERPDDMKPPLGPTSPFLTPYPPLYHPYHHSYATVVLIGAPDRLNEEYYISCSCVRQPRTNWSFVSTEEENTTA